MAILKHYKKQKKTVIGSKKKFNYPLTISVVKKKKKQSKNVSLYRETTIDISVPDLFLMFSSTSLSKL